jgi:hypothetical protein
MSFLVNARDTRAHQQLIKPKFGLGMVKNIFSSRSGSIGVHEMLPCNLFFSINTKTYTIIFYSMSVFSEC